MPKKNKIDPKTQPHALEALLQVFESAVRNDEMKGGGYVLDRVIRSAHYWEIKKELFRVLDLPKVTFQTPREPLVPLSSLSQEELGYYYEDEDRFREFVIDDLQ